MEQGPEALLGTLQWTTWHQEFGELHTSVFRAKPTLVTEREPERHFEHGFLFSWAEAIHTGATEIQENIVSEHLLGMPEDPSQPARLNARASSGEISRTELLASAQRPRNRGSLRSAAAVTPSR